MNTRFRLDLERLDEKITPAGNSSLSVVAPDNSVLRAVMNFRWGTLMRRSRTNTSL